MSLVQTDDMRAFEEIYRRHSAQAYSVARLICNGTSRAEDATQDGFVAIWRGRQTYDPARGGLRAWLLMVVRHRSIDLMRREGPGDIHRAPDEALTVLEAPGSVVDDTERDETAAQVRVSLRRLPLFQREAIALAYFGGLTHAEIANRLGLPVGTVKGRVRLGMRKVRVEALRSGNHADGTVRVRRAGRPGGERRRTLSTPPESGHLFPELKFMYREWPGSRAAW